MSLNVTTATTFTNDPSISASFSHDSSIRSSSEISATSAPDSSLFFSPTSSDPPPTQSSSYPQSSSTGPSSSSPTPSSTSATSTSVQTTSQSLTDSTSVTQVPTTSTIDATSSSGGTTIYAPGLATSLASPAPNRAAITRTAIIAGTAAGVIVIALITLGAILSYRRHKRRQRRFLEGVAAVARKESRGLLDGEGFDDDDAVAMRSYRDGKRSSSPTPSLIRSRASEAGSIFREEVWPPPGEESRFVDPIEKNSSQVDLSRIVNDVMGPSVMVSAHGRDRTYTTVSSAHSNSSTSQLLGSSSRHGPTAYHDSFRSLPNSEVYSQALLSTNSPSLLRPNASSSFPLSNSSTSLLLDYSSGRGPAYTDPFQARQPLPSTSAISLPPGAAPAISFYSPPPGIPKPSPASHKAPSPAFPPAQYTPPSLASANPVTLPIISAPGPPPIPPPRSPARGSTQPLPKPPPKVKVSPPNAYRPVGPSDPPIRGTQPRNSSPLARALTQDAKIWLGRSPNRGPSPGDDA